MCNKCEELYYVVETKYYGQIRRCKVCRDYYFAGISQIVQDKPSSLRCPSCSSSKVWKNGKTAKGLPRYICGQCKTRWTHKL